MKISLNWLKDYVDIGDIAAEELCDRMTMSGFEVEEMIRLSDCMNNVVVGRIEKLSKHPDADRLQICSMDIGTGTAEQIVTGADNVFEGALVPVALHDSHLPNGVHIKRGKLRGVESNGMLCSGEELCLKEEDYPGAGVHGILILQEEVPTGTDLRDVLHLNDTIIDFSVLANRPDCQSVLGLAREISVVLGLPFHPPVPAYHTHGGNIDSLISVTVEDYDLCPRYIGRAVSNLRIGESPEWMKIRLRAAGMRPINNIVDITNFVMLETGQPMHAFDRRDIHGNKIIVRRAEDSESITTLDGKEHALTHDMLVIADGSEPSCLAGIMGGLNSEIKEDTTELFLESAKFRRDSVRKTSRALGVRTESSARFEKGVDIMGTSYAMDRALQLIEQLDAGDIVEGVIDRNNGLPKPRILRIPCEKIRELLGIEIDESVMADILCRLDVPTVLENGTLVCTVPSFRDDLESRADLAEEIIRIYGYDHIIGRAMTGKIVRGKKLPDRMRTDRIKTVLCGAGAREITTYSFISSHASDLLRLSENDPRRQAIRLLNPLGEEFSTLRTQLYTSMLTVMATNINRKNPPARLFEVSRLYRAKSLPVTEQPDELPALCIGMWGEKEDFFTLKGLVEQVLSLNLPHVTFEASNEPFFHPGRQARALSGETVVAELGEMHPAVADNFGIGERVYLAQIMLEPLLKATKKTVLYRPLPKFPAVDRDLALICERTQPVAELEAIIRKSAGRLLEEVHLFDVYEGNQISSDQKSVAYSLRLRADDRTLTDEEASDVIAKVVAALGKAGAMLRS